MSFAKCWRLTLLVALITLPIGVSAQDLWPEMDKYATVTNSPGSAVSPRAELINHHSAPLVAAFWDYLCPGRGDFSGHGGSSDAAMNFAPPADTGAAFQIAAPREGCEGKVTAIVWADGKEIGNPVVITQFHDCRAAAWDEMHTFLDANVFNFPQDKWDPVVSVERLKGKLAPEGTLHGLGPHDYAIHICRGQILQSLTQSLENYRSVVANQPDQLIQRRGLFLQYLKEWEQALIAPSYPTSRIWWNRL